MATDETANLTLPYILAAQAQKHVPYNEAIRALDAVVQIGIIDRDLATPPAGPAEGDRYIVAASAIGAWAGHTNEIAAFQDGAWMFYAPRAGWLAAIADEALVVAFDGSAWQPAVRKLPLLGINATADAANKLSVSSSAVLFNHAGAGIQQKLNKNAAGDTTSLLLQTNWSGRAEIGTCGDDNLHIKVSPDGSAWKEALVIEAATGVATFGYGSSQMQVDVFTASGTWTKPAWARVVEVWALGAGGGGGAGRRGAAASVRAGGNGGGAGGLVWETFAGSEIGPSLSVTVGAGGGGGAATTANDTSGIAGSTGGSTTVSDGATVLLSAPGGSGGAGGAQAAATSASGGPTNGALANGGGTTSITSTAGAGNSTTFARGAGGGGSGASITAADGRLSPSAGGNGYHIGGNARRANGGASGGSPAGTPGGAGAAKAWQRGAGSGAGGGACGDISGTVAGGNGGNGGDPGGGGGGGGAAANGVNSGAGGNGGRGEAWIISYS